MESDPISTPRRGRRVAAIGALVALALVVVELAVIVVRHPGLVLLLALLATVFFAGMWTLLARREWWRWVFGAVGGAAGLGLLVVALGLSWVAASAVIGVFVFSAIFAVLTRYALGGRVEVPM